MKEPKIIERYVKWQEEDNSTLLLTKYDNGAIAVEPIDSEEAALWHAKLGGF